MGMFILLRSPGPTPTICTLDTISSLPNAQQILQEPYSVKVGRNTAIQGRRTVEYMADNYRPPWRTFLQTCCRSVAVTQNTRPPRSLMMHQRTFRSCYKCVAVTSLTKSTNGSGAKRISGCCIVSSFSGGRWKEESQAKANKDQGCHAKPKPTMILASSRQPRK